jgi:hypothetical protein
MVILQNELAQAKTSCTRNRENACGFCASLRQSGDRRNADGIGVGKNDSGLCDCGNADGCGICASSRRQLSQTVASAFVPVRQLRQSLLRDGADWCSKWAEPNPIPPLALSSTDRSCLSLRRVSDEHALIRRGAGGRLLPGGPALNPGGRPRGVIEDVCERLGPYTAEFCAALVDLKRSRNEATRLAAIREFFDRLLGKPAIAVDTTVTKSTSGRCTCGRCNEPTSHAMLPRLTNWLASRQAMPTSPGNPTNGHAGGAGG